MTLPRRLFLFGAVIPTLFLALGLVATGVLLERQLLAATDRALLSQAAIESVSLFDGASGEPHLHLERSPLSDVVAGFAPHAALYDRSGDVVVVADPHRLAPARLDPRTVGRVPEPSTRTAGATRVREARLLVESPSSGTYALWVGVPLDAEDRTLALYSRAALLVLVGSSLVFVVLQQRLARGLTDRLDRLARHAESIRAGRYDPPAPDPGGDVIGSLRDAFAAATDRLRSSHEAEKRLVADAAHELRTPLSAMRAVIDTTLRRERSSEELREALVTVRSEVDRLATLATELLDLAVLRQVDAARELTDVTVAVQSAVDSLRSLADERSIALVVDSSGRTSVRAIPDQIRRAAENLVANAIRFAPVASEVHVAVERTPRQLRISVADEGEGVAEADREAIFEPFRRGARAAGRGAGLGLAIVRDVARRHGGEAWVEPTERGGARFVLAIAVPAEET